MPLTIDIEGRIRPRRDEIFADVIIARMRERNGIVLPDDSILREWNVKDRWFRVRLVGPEIDWLEPGEWILVRHGRWTLGWKMTDPETGERHEMYRIDPDGVMLAADEPLTDERNLGSTGENRG